MNKSTSEQAGAIILFLFLSQRIAGESFFSALPKATTRTIWNKTEPGTVHFHFSTFVLMDFPHIPAEPQGLLLQVQAAVDEFLAIFNSRKCTSLKLSAKVTPKSYGCSVRISWLSQAGCACFSELCQHNDCVREVLMKIRDDFSMEALRHALAAESIFYHQFCQ